MKDAKDISKGDFQHKMYKLIILIIVFIFICLIGGFIYVTFSSTSPNYSQQTYNDKKAIMKSNEKYYKTLTSTDELTFIKNNNKTSLSICNKENFYKEQIYYHLPCIYNNSKENDECLSILNRLQNLKDYSHVSVDDLGTISFIDKYFKYLTIETYNKFNENSDYFSFPKLNNVGRILINYSKQKLNLYLCPVSQIGNFNSFKKKSNSEYLELYLKNSIYDQKEKLVYYKTILNEGDFIYVPSYYFLEIKEKVEGLLSYEYQDISTFQDAAFKALYDIEIS